MVSQILKQVNYSEFRILCRDWLQREKNRDHIAPVLYNLYWLLVHARITFKVLLTTYKALNGITFAYITELLHEYHPVRTLYSSSSNLLVIPPTQTVNYGNRAFSICAPKLWSSLPASVKSADSRNCCKCRLNTFLFKNYF